LRPYYRIPPSPINEKVQKFGVWVPCVMSESQRSVICADLLARHRAACGHYPIITGDEKWCLHMNLKQRKEWISPSQQPTPRTKLDLHSCKVMICDWLDWLILNYTFSVNSQLYIQEMKWFHTAIQQEMPDLSFGVILEHEKCC